MELKMSRKGGKDFIVRITGKIITDELNESQNEIKKPKLFLIINDITKQKKAEELFIESESNFRLLFENSPLGTYIAQTDGSILDANHTLLKMLGSPSVEATKQINVLTLPNLVNNGYADYFRICIEEKKIQQIEIEYTSTWGKATYMSSFIIPLIDDSGNVQKIYTIMEDISERKSAEDKLIKIHEELKISKEIIETNLFQKNILVEELSETNIKLEKTNSEKDKFFSIIAHDLRSPFNGFLGLTQMMSENIYNFSLKELQDISTSMQKSASNLFQLLNNLLEWSMMQRVGIKFKPGLYKLFEIVKQNLDLKFDDAKQKNINIINHVSEDIEVNVDLQMLNTIFRNLISNALKFTSRGGKIEVGATVQPSEGSVVIYVKDSGIGMNEDIINNLFKLDHNVSRPGTEKEPSSGLGLILCKEFVEKHGGKIWVESEVGKGSMFYFSLKS
jgi:PAS domain S-box-containing protein